MGARAEVVYLGGANPPGSSLQAHDQTRVERNWGGIHLEYGSDGKVGVTSMLQTMTAITNAFVLIGMATFIVDFIGTFFPKFYADKYEDDGEREILEDIAKHLTDRARGRAARPEGFEDAKRGRARDELRGRAP